MLPSGEEGFSLRERRERQAYIVQVLRESTEPIRGEDLAVKCQVTRQVVVHEVALLKARGTPIVSTPRGYYLSGVPDGMEQTVLSVHHGPEQTADELYTLVDHGIVVENVMIEHPIYGELQGALHLRSRHDVSDFLQEIARGRVALLSSLTQGDHLHTVSYHDLRQLDQAIVALEKKGIVARR